MKKYIISLVALLVTVTASADIANGYYKGDINNDSNVDIQDVALLINVLNNPAKVNVRCYLDSDNDVDLDDLSILVDMVLQNNKVLVETEATIPAGEGDDKPTIVEAKGATFKKIK